MEIYKELKVQLDEQLLQISKQTQCPVKQAKLSISECILTLEKLKLRVAQCSFKTKEQEINFFKHLKPQISAKLIFSIQQFNIETRKPTGTIKQLTRYFSNHLKSINRFMEDNIAFYQYCRSEETFMDEKYFIRSKNNLHLILEQHDYNYDITFNTSHDNKVAQILANDLLRDYLQKQLNRLEQNLFSEGTPLPLQQIKPLNWTDSKTALMELIYAIHATGSVNNGKVDVKEIAAYLETHFNIKLGDLYRNFHELRYRKTNRTKYIDKLKENLEKRMDGIDERLN